jgi:hypothetical protein
MSLPISGEVEVEVAAMIVELAEQAAVADSVKYHSTCNLVK